MVKLVKWNKLREAIQCLSTEVESRREKLIVRKENTMYKKKNDKKHNSFFTQPSILFKCILLS